jgi:lipoprotein-anchoring transpeptidase ErfK/SrfK
MKRLVLILLLIASPAWTISPGWIHIDRRELTLRYTEGDQAWIFPVCIGRKGTQDKATCTPAGEYRIIYKKKNPWYRNVGEDAEWVPPYNQDKRNKYGTRIMGLDYRRTESSRRMAIHGTNEPELIPGYYSAMCIRLRNEDVEFLYNKVENGCRVIIE